MNKRHLILIIIFMIYSFFTKGDFANAQEYDADKTSFAEQSFWSNILKTALINDDNILERISQNALLRREFLLEQRRNPQAKESLFAARIWINESSIQNQYRKSYPWQEDFEISGLGINIGADIIPLNFGGFFLSHKDMKARQNSIKGEVSDMRIGAYKSFLSKPAYIYSVFSLGNQSIRVKKDGETDYCDSYSLRISVDSDFNPKQLIYPFIGMRIAMTFNDEIKTYYEDIGEIEISRDSQVRFEGLSGIKMRYSSDLWTLGLKLNALCILKGARTHYGRIEGNHEDVISAALGFLVQYKIGSRMVLFTNGSVQKGPSLTSGYSLNAGFGFMIDAVKRVRVLSEDEAVPNYLDLSNANDMGAQEIVQAKITNEIRMHKREVENPILKTNPKLRQIASLDNSSYIGKGAELKAETKSELEAIAANIKSENNKKIIVIGHVANKKSEEENEALSFMRARQTAMELEINDIPKEKIQYYGLGSRLPLSEDRKKNDRVEIFVE